jgi:hypothetical protein
VFRVDLLAAPGAEATDVQLSFTTREPLDPGGRHEVSFWAQAAASVEFSASVRLHEAPWTLLAPDSETTVQAGPEWRRVGIAFSPAAAIPADSEVRCPGLFLGELPAGTTLQIAGVTLAETAPPPPPVPLRLSTELLRNPAFEEGLDGWTAQAAELVRAPGLGRNGSTACLARQRTARWGSPSQDIRETLAATGMGVYQFSAAVRKVQGRGQVLVVIHLRDTLGERWIVSPRRSVDARGWARPAAQRLLAWTGSIEAADLSVQTTGDDNEDVLVDDLSLRALANLAAGGAHSASTEAPGQRAGLAFDGNPATGWLSAAPGMSWLEVDLGQTQAFNGCLVGVQARRSGEYEIQYWHDGWQKAFSGNDLRAPLDHLCFPPVSASRVRLWFGAGSTAPTVTEFGVHTCSSLAGGISQRRIVLPPPADFARRGVRTLVGAIRWDGWCGDRHPVGLGLEQAMAPDKYHYRLPFYAAVPAPGRVETRCTTQAVMDRELAFAQEAGIDYWAFDWYPPGSGLALARDLYLSSSRRGAVKWCVILATNPFADSDRAWLVEQFRMPAYQCVLGDRPLVYIFAASAKHAGLVRELREEAASAGVPSPFVVLMGWSAAVAEAADACGADALGAYVTPLGNRSTFAANMAHEQRQWQALKSTGRQVVATVTTGWDPRPFLDCPVPWYHGASDSHWVETATPAEIATHLRQAIAFTEAQPESTLANTVLIYAWNENAEGGWIIPTLHELRTAGHPLRLDAVRSVLKPDTSPGSGWEELSR